MIYHFDAEGTVDIVQISDCHLSPDRQRELSGVVTYDSLQQVLNSIRANDKAQLLLLTGDLTHDGEPEAYQLLQALLEPLAIPWFWLPGNHDLSAAMAQAATHTRLASKQILLDHWQLLLLDSHQDHQVNGVVSQSELSWLATALKEHPDKYAAVFVHHHLLPVGSDWIDRQRIANAEQLLTLFDATAQLRFVACGHVHQEWQVQRGHYSLLSSPSTCVQFQRHSADFATDTLPPGYRRFTLFADGSYQTRVCRIEHVLDIKKER